MTDKELLELAAKAAGVPYEIDNEGSMWTPKPWFPLTDDGDALRLAVKLNLHIQIDFEECEENQLVYVYGNWIGQGIEEPPDYDPYAATRRAIVRAAAELGRG
jgi:hypothetical protein